MQKFRGFMIIGLGFTLLATSFVLMRVSPTLAQGTNPPDAQDVRVVNGAAEPVPVAAVNGRDNPASVRVENSVRVIPEQGHVLVDNDAQSPVPVELAPSSEPVRVCTSCCEPVHASVGASLFNGETFKAPVLYTVPAGKRLIVDYIGGQGVVPVGQAPFWFVHWTTNGASVGIELNRGTPDLAGTNKHYEFGHMIHFCADGGTDLKMDFERRGGSTGTGGGRITISGHLEPMP